MDFRDHRGQAATLGQVVGMCPMTADRQIGVQQVGAYPGRHRLLPDRQMGRASHQSLGVAISDGFFHAANELHRPQQGETIDGHGMNQ